jgi:hypothetical protein
MKNSGILQSSSLSSVPKRTRTCQEFLDNDSTEMGTRDCSHILGTKGPSKRFMRAGRREDGGRSMEVKVTEILQSALPNFSVQLMGPPLRFLGNLKESVRWPHT